MSNDPASTSRGEPSALDKASQLRNHEFRFLKALKLLVDAGKAKSVEDLIRYAEQDKQTEATNFLRTMVTERLPVELAYDALSVNLRLVAHKRNSSVLQECLKRQVGLVMPLPPHVIDALTTLMPVTILQPDGHHLPLCAESSAATIVRGTRAGRAAMSQLNAVVFEVFSNKSEWYIDGEASNLIENRLGDADLLLIAHARPHQNPSDVPLVVESGRIQLI